MFFLQRCIEIHGDSGGLIVSRSRIAVIGGSGFIGSALIRRLVQSQEPVCNIDIVAPTQNNNSPFHLVDVRNTGGLIKALEGTEVIYLLAAEHRDDVRPVRKYYDVNVDGARAVAQVARRLGIRHIIFTSSVAVYGLNSQNADESRPPNPFNDYGRSKLEAEQVLIEWQQEFGAQTLSIVRPAVVFGPGNRGNVYTLLRQMQSRAFAMIGSGRNRKSMAYVDNVAAFLDFLRGRPEGLHLYNYADKPDLTMNDLIGATLSLRNGRQPLQVPYSVGLLAGYCFDAVALLRNKPLPISSIRVKKFCVDTTVDATRAHNSGFCAEHSLVSGLRAMVQAEFM